MRDHHREPNETKMRSTCKNGPCHRKNMRKTTRRPSHRPCDSSAAPALRTKSPWCNVNRKENATRATTRRVLAPTSGLAAFVTVTNISARQRAPRIHGAVLVDRSSASLTVYSETIQLSFNIAYGTLRLPVGHCDLDPHVTRWSLRTRFGQSWRHFWSWSNQYLTRNTRFCLGQTAP